ncbi:hypothetical protein RP20_CCG005726 [Aedes albopictus]|nr:hypothetical protein RP20_CCG005726 [Aedes albopictus]
MELPELPLARSWEGCPMFLQVAPIGRFEENSVEWKQKWCMVAGVSATTERLTAPPAPPQGHSPHQLLDEPHMSIAAAENAGVIITNRGVAKKFDTDDDNDKCNAMQPEYGRDATIRPGSTDDDDNDDERGNTSPSSVVSVLKLDGRKRSAFLPSSACRQRIVVIIDSQRRSLLGCHHERLDLAQTLRPKKRKTDKHLSGAPPGRPANQPTIALLLLTTNGRTVAADISWMKLDKRTTSEIGFRALGL